MTPKTLVMTFGRFQPPTSGHEILFRSMVASASTRQGDAIVFLSQTQNDKNPLTHQERDQIIHKSVPKITIGPATVRSPNEALTWAKDQGYSRVVFWMGGDRQADFDRMVKSWTNAIDPEHTVTVQITPIPRTGPFAESLVSGSVARQFAQQGKLRDFQGILMSKSRSYDEARLLMKKIQQRLRPLKEHIMTAIPTFASWILTEGPDSPEDAGTEAEAPATPAAPTTPAKRALDDTRDEDRVLADTEENQAKLVIHPPIRLKNTLSTKAAQLRQMSAK